MSTELAAPLARVCRVLDAPRSTVHYRRRHLRLVADGQIGNQSGPVGTIGDEDLVGLIRTVLTSSPFAGEGYRKIRARLRRQQPRRARVGQAGAAAAAPRGVLAPQRATRRRKPRLHVGRIVTDAPDLR